MATLRIPRPISGGLMLSYRCNAACRHCMYNCSPKWPADWINEADLERCLSILADKIEPSPWGPDHVGLNHGLHFSGGEPFLNYDLLLKAAQIGTELGIPSLFVETNCFWCKQDDNARDKLEKLKAAGLKGIMISVNPYYAEHVPFERTERCVKLSGQVFDENVYIYQTDCFFRFLKLGVKGKISPETLAGMIGNERSAERIELFLSGRACLQLNSIYPKYPAEVFCRQPCQPPLIREWHNHWDNYGNMMPGYCGGISLGDWRELDEYLKNGVELDDKPVLKLLALDDLQGLIRFAGDFGYAERPEGYVSKCHLCLDIRKHLVSRGEFKELTPLRFYQDLDESNSRPIADDLAAIVEDNPHFLT